MADKTKSIKEQNDKELGELLLRLRREAEAQSLIQDMKRRAAPPSPYNSYDETPRDFSVSTEAPVESLYHKVDELLEHAGVIGMKWGHRKGSSTVSTDKAKKKIAKAEARAAKKQDKTLRSPTKLYRNRDKFDQEEIDQAMKRMKWERELRSLSRDEISTGSQYANAVLGYGTVAVAAYGIYKSPLGQAIKTAALK